MSAAGDGFDDPARRDAAAALVVLRRRVDAHFDAAIARSPTAFACRAGCAACCRPGLSVFAVEATRLEAAIARLPEPTRQRLAAQGAAPPAEHCALLVDDLCAVYEERPLLCRSHGLAVAAPADGDGPRAVDHCRLNYTETSPPPASVLDVDAINKPLSVMAQMWGGSRVALAALARRAVREA